MILISCIQMPYGTFSLELRVITSPPSGALPSGTPRAFAVYWMLKDSFSVGEKGAMALAREAETLVTRFPNAAVNAEELRHLRAALYKPLLGLHKNERGEVVRHILALLVSPGDDES